MKRIVIAVGIGLIAALVLYVAGVTTLAGAHPRWADQLFYSGAGLGTVLALIAIQFAFVPRTIALSVTVIAAYLVADFGKTRFAASFAEDVVAGQMWFFGWHVLCITIIAHVMSSLYEQLRSA
ncbi:hypothetical protein [Loktanella sp. Alg231-35]|uniref:hypothetical protein n=1 Tax=Loktanella sp. Alg231-35 TaxID=1922220 RepID=UPI000D5521AF|nr:hypothetical protein [Loktanella sp. Alg231-35]